MFVLESMTPVRLSNFNARAEKHGSDHVPAVDINFTLDAQNSILSYFDGHLLSALYHKSAANEPPTQGELDGVPAVADMPNLRFPKLAPLRWAHQLAGYRLEIDYGLGEGSNLELDECNVGKFVLEPKEGGTVEVKFQVQCNSGLTERIMGKLMLLIGQEVDITLTAPEVRPAAEVAPATETKGRKGGKRKGEAQVDLILPGADTPDPAPLTAEDVFIAGHAPGCEPEATFPPLH